MPVMRTRIKQLSLISGAAIIGLLLLLIVATSTRFSADTRPAKSWSSAELQTLQSLALSRLHAHQDHSNQYATDKAAIDFGTQLFFDQRLSRHSNISCASCHKPDQYFADRLTMSMGADIGRRNTPSLHGVTYNDWFFWDGRKDSLWAQALAPLENPAEHDFSRTAVTKLLLSDKNYYQTYKKIFGQPAAMNPATLSIDAQPSGSIEQIKAWKALPIEQRRQVDRIFANTGKALAAYVSTLKPLTSRFDTYAAAVQSNTGNSDLFRDDELRGLRLFISKKAGCINCHSGPLLTNQSFHNIGSGGPGDTGRAAAISRVKLDRFNCLGEYSDATAEQCRELRFMQTDRHQLLGSFKTPGLRNVSNTPPYFHDGRYQTLAEVLDHYTNAKPGATHLPAIELSTKDKQDLIAFLKTLAAIEYGK